MSNGYDKKIFRIYIGVEGKSDTEIKKMKDKLQQKFVPVNSTKVVEYESKHNRLVIPVVGIEYGDYVMEVLVEEGECDVIWNNW